MKANERDDAARKRENVSPGHEKKEERGEREGGKNKK
jgi:hypothetical protein